MWDRKMASLIFLSNMFLPGGGNVGQKDGISDFLSNIFLSP
jgi:hypothetical protein